MTTREPPRGLAAARLAAANAGDVAGTCGALKMPRALDTAARLALALAVSALIAALLPPLLRALTARLRRAGLLPPAAAPARAPPPPLRRAVVLQMLHRGCTIELTAAEAFLLTAICEGLEASRRALRACVGAAGTRALVEACWRKGAGWCVCRRPPDGDWLFGDDD
ncbi:hypothetical protein MNEG_7285 [Monoraphidium neglectum]|jgi:hypothetical protein|uniref:Uncharacterized protein n=1 Tax=Monoraphidium neglectum TaxID=145388 RepID=A0A0D2N3N7_9CHLO|nr:hypothetical protein MNEG_7285 [Monoraphidium neglectum]KIZ00676.1 hypothetical protein MNEG_7285 [Monoraphidium neglectum]|eukprot:XP_013899695.1 hypothetical protein MNEG_7285 [Monoraphidium neglectum]